MCRRILLSVVVVTIVAVITSLLSMQCSFGKCGSNKQPSEPVPSQPETPSTSTEEETTTQSGEVATPPSTLPATSTETSTPSTVTTPPSNEEISTTSTPAAAEEERKRRKAEKQRRIYEDARRKRIESTHRVNQLIERDNVGPIDGNRKTRTIDYKSISEKAANIESSILNQSININDKEEFQSTTPPEKPVKKELGIALRRDNDKWIPNPEKAKGNESRETKVIAELYEKEGGKWVKTNEKRIITFTFDKNSKEKGECVNSYKRLRGYDLKFYQSKNPTMNCKVGRLIKGSAETKSTVSKKTVVVSCKDFGAFSKISATAVDCVPLKNINGKIFEVKSNAVTVPKDDNNNQIADAYEDRVGQHPKATDDNDNKPEGNGFDGDGLSAYEEYRGFRVKKKHRRTSWLNKDLFIYNTTGIETNTFAVKSGFTCWEVKRGELSPERRINFYGEYAQIVKQHGLIMKRGTPSPPGADGSTTTKTKTNGPPGNVIAVIINPDTKAPVTTATHELGHATGLPHHGPQHGKFSLLVFFPMDASEDFKEDVMRKIRARNEGTSVSSMVVGVDSICGQPLNNIFYLYTPGTTLSGDEFCYMRYQHSKAAVYFDFRGFFMPEFECPNDSGQFNRFCDSMAGTGFNAGGRCAGDAIKPGGNCKSKFVVSDLYKGGN